MDNYIFDFDGTLADTESVIVRCWELACSELLLPKPDINVIRSSMGLELDKVAKVVTGSINPDMVGRSIQIYRDNYSKESSNVRLFDGIMSVLTSLIDCNRSLFIVSAKSSDALLRSVDNLEIRSLFVDLIGREDVDAPKPNPESVYLLIKKHNLDPSKTIMVGDATVDIEMGKNAHISTCGVTWGSSTKDILAIAYPDWIIGDVSEILNIYSLPITKR